MQKSIHQRVREHLEELGIIAARRQPEGRY